ncbi:MAG: AAA family ATPase [Candidatus Eremiobacterota bacterium]
MINKLSIKNFGTLKDISWNNLAGINLIIGENGTGKSFLLKSLYSAVKTIEDYMRGDDVRTTNEILAEKLRWTFQTDRLGELVTKGQDKHLSFDIKFDNKSFSYSFSKDTNIKLNTVTNETSNRESNSIFLPAKEVLSIFNIILKSREVDKSFGFDDTYFDLAKALKITPKMGKNYKAFSESRKKLENILGGAVEFDEQSSRWQFKKGNQKFSIGATSEGVKKIAILDNLLANRYINTSSIIFIDEPEAALHPSAISDFLDIVAILSDSGIQFFLASHSYFVLKKLALIAKQKSISIPVISIDVNAGMEAAYDDLKIVMPKNSIINESIRLYKEEISEVIK